MSTASPAERLLARLDGVRASGAGRWLARCPAHRDKSPSLSVRQLDDERVLVNCFGGCGAADVLAAVGLEMRDLYPAPLVDHASPTKPGHFHAARVALDALADEGLVVLLAAEHLAAGVPLTDQDRERLAECIGRVRRAAAVLR